MKKAFFLSVLVSAVFVCQINAAITETNGWLETFYVKWDKAACAAKYNVEYKAVSASSWTKIDDQLIREYGDHFRADVLGLSAGAYDVRVTPVNGGVDGEAMTETNIQVSAHDRSGFAFKGGIVPGAYKADGTLKDNVQIFYITDKNKDTLSFAVKTSSNGSTTNSKGVQAIVKALEKGYEDRPMLFRFIGKVTDVGFTLDGGDITIKKNKNYLTLEGIGNDAVLYGLGIKTSGSTKLEVRNLGFMLTNSDEGDNVGLNSGSENVWIHNNDMFYGNPGSDADQVKGDGSTDVKGSTNITISYNHYFDNGKVHLLGNKETPPGYVTYHHNWYDHSDSRHPRVRVHYAHVYNNYYDGVATYGIGATMNSSIFSEKNYFRNTNRPMLISMQGTDEGTFSSEDGGIIKAFGNFMDNGSKQKYKPYSAANTIEFDAYEVTDAATEVPNTVKAKKGGGTYNNNMLADYPSYTPENDSAAVRTKVTTYAGRYWRGDFGFTFNNATDDSDHSVNNALKTSLSNYVSGLVKIQEAGAGGSVSCQNPSSSSVPSSSSAPSSSSVPSSSSGVLPSSSSVLQSSNSVCEGTEIFWNFSDTKFTSELPDNDEGSNIEQSYTVDGLTFVHGTSDMSYTLNSKSIDGYEFTHRFQLGGAGSITNRAVKFDVSEKSSIIVYGMSGNSGSTRALALSNGTTELQTVDFPGDAISGGVYSYDGNDESTLYLYSKNSGINLYGIKVKYCDGNITPIVLPVPVFNNALNVMKKAVSLQVSSNATVKIYDLKGKVVRSFKFEKGSYIIPLGDLPQGLYIVKAKTASWQKTGKVIF